MKAGDGRCLEALLFQLHDFLATLPSPYKGYQGTLGGMRSGSGIKLFALLHRTAGVLLTLRLWFRHSSKAPEKGLTGYTSIKCIIYSWTVILVPSIACFPAWLIELVNKIPLLLFLKPIELKDNWQERLALFPLGPLFLPWRVRGTYQTE